MKRFILKTLLFAVITSGTVYLSFSLADGYTDHHYIHFTTPRQQNLILGTSRASQGLNPEVFHKHTNKPFYNYAFTLMHSPFGPTYLSSIKRKLDHNTVDGIFIIAIDPWSISSMCDNPNDTADFRERDLCLGNTTIMNMKPNVFYLLKNLNGRYNQLFFPQSKLFLHHNGWLEVTAPMDSVSVQKRTRFKLKKYRENKLPKYKFSKKRLEYLNITIRFLKEHGNVYLVRLPVYPGMRDIENQLMPDFNQKINSAVSICSGYKDLSVLDADLTYTDGNHLHKDSGVIVSSIIANWIKKQTSDKPQANI